MCVTKIKKVMILFSEEYSWFKPKDGPDSILSQAQKLLDLF